MCIRDRVVVELTPSPGAPETSTDVTLTHLGFGPEPHWTETRQYFQKAWPYVLGQLKATPAR